jgi:hypothetical protein
MSKSWIIMSSPLGQVRRPRLEGNSGQTCLRAGDPQKSSNPREGRLCFCRKRWLSLPNFVATKPRTIGKSRPPKQEAGTSATVP